MTFLCYRAYWEKWFIASVENAPSSEDWCYRKGTCRSLLVEASFEELTFSPSCICRNHDYVHIEQSKAHYHSSLRLLGQPWEGEKGVDGVCKGRGGGDMTIVQCISVIIFEKQRKKSASCRKKKNERDILLTLVGAREPVPLETWRVLFYFLNYTVLVSFNTITRYCNALRGYK